MDTNFAKNARRNSIVVAILLIMAIFGILALFLTFIPSHALITIFAIITFMIAVVLPFRQKRPALYPIVLAVSGILFLLSGVIDDAYHTVVSPLPVLKQIEFSKIMRPMQVSRGLWNLAAGILYFLISFAWFQTKESPEKPKSKRLKFLLLIMAVLGVLFAVLGISSIVGGLSKL